MELTALLAVLGIFATACALFVQTLRDLYRIVRPNGPRAMFAAGAVVKALSLVAVLAIPTVAADLTYASTGWTDPDGDGMQASMVNGAYDWGDVNGATFGPIALTMLAGVVLVTVVVVWFVRLGARGIEDERRAIARVADSASSR